MTAPTRKPMSRSERNVQWVREYLHAPFFRLVMTPERMAAMRAAYDDDTVPHNIVRNPPKVGSLFTVPILPGDFTFTAAIALLHVCGPEAIRKSQIDTRNHDPVQSSMTFCIASLMIAADEALAAVIIHDEPAAAAALP